MDQDATWYGGIGLGVGQGHIVWPAPPYGKGYTSPPLSRLITDALQYSIEKDRLSHFKQFCSRNGWVDEKATALLTVIIQNQVKVNLLQSVSVFVNGAIVQAMS